MLETITKAVQEAIDTNLSGEVAGRLKTFIKDAEITKSNLEIAMTNLHTTKTRLSEIEVFEHTYTDLRARETDIKAKEQKLNFEEKVLEIKTDCQNRRVEEIRGLVETVFRSNRLGYNINLGSSEYNSSTCQTKNKNIDGSITPQED